MFAPRVAKPNAKTAAALRESGLPVRGHNGDSEYFHRRQQKIGNQEVLRLLPRQSLLEITGLMSCSRDSSFVSPSRFLASRIPRQVQTKLKVGASDDSLEREAERAAEQVMHLGSPERVFTSAAPGRKRAESEEPDRLHRKGAAAEATVDEAPASVHEVLRSPGRPLDPKTRGSMERRFGQDFSGVSVHSDDASAQSARLIGANAYTSGHHIVFDAGRFSPNTLAGQRLLVHELTHVVQQSGAARDAQIGLIQRDDKHKEDDASQEEKEALINFKDDWRNNFSHYEKLVKIDKPMYSKTQHEEIKATKNKDRIVVVLGKGFATETDEETRWGWIKREVIDKNVKADKFEDLGYDPTHSTIKKIAPPDAVGHYCTLNCPATAASLDHYLRTGEISPAICNTHKENIPGYGFDISMDTFGQPVSWEQAEKTIKPLLTKHGQFVIIEGTRSEKQIKDNNNVAPTHYFSIVNIKGSLFAIDAFSGGIVSDDIKNYIATRVIATTYRLAKGEFKVKEVVPK
jgi:Domain of unknown function (DUF4157)